LRWIKVPNKKIKPNKRNVIERPEPEVILDFEYDDGVLYLIIENIGPSSAYKVSIKFDKEITGMEGQRKISAMRIFECIEFLSPHKKIRIFVDTFASYLLRKQPLIIGASVIYSNKNNKEFQNLINHDLSIYQDFPHILK
jgi:hypothetical protein